MQNRNVASQPNNREENYSDVLAWLGIAESDVKADVDLQVIFQEKSKIKYIRQDFCLRMLKCIRDNKWTGKKNFTIAIFNFVLTTDFSKINKARELLNDFNQSLPVHILKALCIDSSPDLDFLKRVIAFALKQGAKMKYIYPLAIQCIEKNKALIGSAHYEAVMQQLREAIRDHSNKEDGVISEYLFGAAMKALATIAEEESNTPPKEKEMADWIKEIGKSAQIKQKADLIIYNSAMEAYVRTDSPTWNFALKLINFAKKEKEKLEKNEKGFSKEIEYYFTDAINLSAAINKLDSAMAFYEAAAKEKYLTNSMGHALFINIERGRLKPNSLPETLIKIISLQEKHTKMDIRLYTKVFDVLIKIKYFDMNLSKKIIEHAKRTYKLNKIMLASHFLIALQCKEYNIDEHLELYDEMKKQNEGYQDTLIVPTLYQNLILLIASSPACSVEKAKSIFSEAKCSTKMTINIYNAMLSVYDHQLTNNAKLSMSDRKKYLSEFSLLIHEAEKQGLNINEKSETTSVGQEQSLGKFYFKLKSQLDWLRENPSENFISVILRENQENKAVFFKVYDFLMDDFQALGLSLESISDQRSPGCFQLSLRKTAPQEQVSPSETKNTSALVVSSTKTIENTNKTKNGKKKNKKENKRSQKKSLVSQEIEKYSEKSAEIEKKDGSEKSSQLDQLENELKTQAEKIIIKAEMIQSEDLTSKQIEAVEKAEEKLEAAEIPSEIGLVEAEPEKIENLESKNETGYKLSLTEIKAKERVSSSEPISTSDPVVLSDTHATKKEKEESWKKPLSLQATQTRSEEPIKITQMKKENNSEKFSESEEKKSQTKADTIAVPSSQSPWNAPLERLSFEEMVMLTPVPWWSLDEEQEDDNIKKHVSSSAPTNTSDEDNSQQSSEPEEKKSQTKSDTINTLSAKSPWNTSIKIPSFFGTAQTQGTWDLDEEQDTTDLTDDNKGLNDKEKKYQDVLGWLDIEPEDLKRDIDLRAKFQNNIKNNIKAKRVNRGFCLRILNCISYYQWAGKKNFTIVLFDFASTNDFPDIYEPKVIKDNFEAALPLLALMALYADESPDLDFVKRAIQFALIHGANKMKFIYLKAFECIIKNKTLIGLAHHEAVVQMVKEAVTKHRSNPKVFSEHLFGAAVSALGQIAKAQFASGIPPESKKIQDWIASIARAAERRQMDDLIFYNNAMKAYVNTREPNWEFALHLIGCAQKQKETDQEKKKEHGLYFQHAINLSSAVDQFDYSMQLCEEAYNEECLTDAAVIFLFDNIGSGRLKPKSISDTILKILNFLKHAKIKSEFYTKAFEVLVKIKYFDMDLSKKIISRAKIAEKNKKRAVLNEAMLADYFQIAFQCQETKIDEYLLLYKELEDQACNYPNPSSVPEMYQYLILLIARSEACDLALAKKIFRDAKHRISKEKMTIEVFDAMLFFYDHNLMKNSKLPISERNKYLSEISLLMQEAENQGFNLRTETAFIGQEQSLGKIYFHLKDQFDKLKESSSGNSIAIILKEKQDDKTLKKACLFLSDEVQRDGYFLKLIQDEKMPTRFQLFLKEKIASQKQHSSSAPTRTSDPVVSSSKTIENKTESKKSKKKDRKKLGVITKKISIDIPATIKSEDPHSAQIEPVEELSEKIEAVLIAPSHSSVGLLSHSLFFKNAPQNTIVNLPVTKEPATNKINS